MQFSGRVCYTGIFRILSLIPEFVTASCGILFNYLKKTYSGVESLLTIDMNSHAVWPTR